MKTATIFLNLVMVGLIIAPIDQARAAAVLNLDDKPQTIEIEVSGSYRPVAIAPGRVWRMPGNVRVRYKKTISYIEYNQEYAIWKDGTFGPQVTFGKIGGTPE